MLTRFAERVERISEEMICLQKERSKLVDAFLDKDNLVGEKRFMKRIGRIDSQIGKLLRRQRQLFIRHATLADRKQMV